MATTNIKTRGRFFEIMLVLQIIGVILGIISIIGVLGSGHSMSAGGVISTIIIIFLALGVYLLVMWKQIGFYILFGALIAGLLQGILTQLLFGIPVNLLSGILWPLIWIGLWVMARSKTNMQNFS